MYTKRREVTAVNDAELQKARSMKKTAKALKRKKSGSPFMRFIIAITGSVFVLYCAVSIVVTQAEIAEKRQELDALVEKAEKLEEENDEYRSILSEEDERTFMERYAVEVLGYAYPNERRFYDTAGN